MEIITRKNYQLVEALNELLKDANISKRFSLKVIETDSEVGVMVEIPPMFNKDKPSYFLPLKENYKQTDLTYSQIVTNINKELEDLLKMLKPEILKLTRISKSFEKIEKETEPVIYITSIKIQY